MDMKKCRHAECDKLVRADNKSGCCTKHYYWGTHAGAPGSKSTPPRKLNSKPNGRTASVTAGKEATANLCVPESVLDRFWQTLSVDEKATLFMQQLGVDQR
jgi:hypothetical protein